MPPHRSSPAGRKPPSLGPFLRSRESSPVRSSRLDESRDAPPAPAMLDPRRRGNGRGAQHYPPPAAPQSYGGSDVSSERAVHTSTDHYRDVSERYGGGGSNVSQDLSVLSSGDAQQAYIGGGFSDYPQSVSVGGLPDYPLSDYPQSFPAGGLPDYPLESYNGGGGSVVESSQSQPLSQTGSESARQGGASSYSSTTGSVGNHPEYPDSTGANVSLGAAQESGGWAQESAYGQVKWPAVDSSAVFAVVGSMGGSTASGASSGGGVGGASVASSSIAVGRPGRRQRRALQQHTAEYEGRRQAEAEAEARARSERLVHHELPVDAAAAKQHRRLREKTDILARQLFARNVAQAMPDCIDRLKEYCEEPRREPVPLVDARADPTLWSYGISMFVENYEHHAPLGAAEDAEEEVASGREALAHGCSHFTSFDHADEILRELNGAPRRAPPAYWRMSEPALLALMDGGCGMGADFKETEVTGVRASPRGRLQLQQPGLMRPVPMARRSSNQRMQANAPAAHAAPMSGPTVGYGTLPDNFELRFPPVQALSDKRALQAPPVTTAGFHYEEVDDDGSDDDVATSEAGGMPPASEIFSEVSEAISA